MNTSVEKKEIERFDRLASTWWDETGPMRALHAFNPVRVSFIRDAVCAHFSRDIHAVGALSGVSILDTGCGGGVLAEPLARLGAAMTGIDPAPTSIAVAHAHALRMGQEIDYRNSTIEVVVEAGEQFDVVLAMEVIEHVADQSRFVATCAAAVKPGGLLIMATLNRTLKAFALAVVGAEYLLGWLPRGTHDWKAFVTPRELNGWMKGAGLKGSQTRGVVYNPLQDTWRLSQDTDVNYMIVAEKPAS